MAETAWLLNDSAPVPFGQAFDAASPAKLWGWFGMPAAGEGSAFETAAVPWSYDFSTLPAVYLWTAAPPPVGGSGLTLALMGVGA